MNTSIIDQRPMPSTTRYMTGAVVQPPSAAPLGGDQQDAQADQLHHRHGDRGEEHQQRQRPHAGAEQVAHATQDGAGLAGAELGHGEHRIDVGRQIEDQRGEPTMPRCGAMLSRLRGVQRTCRSAGSAHAVASGTMLTRPQVWQPMMCAPARLPAGSTNGARGGDGCRMVDRDRRHAAALHFLPHRLAAEQDVGGNHRQQQGAEGVERGPHLDAHQRAKFHIGNERRRADRFRSSTSATGASPRRTPCECGAAGAAGAAPAARRACSRVLPAARRRWRAARRRRAPTCRPAPGRPGRRTGWRRGSGRRGRPPAAAPRRRSRTAPAR